MPTEPHDWRRAEWAKKQREKRARKKARKAAKKAASHAGRKSFYRSDEWAQLRYDTLKAAGGCCMLCGTKASEGAHLQVDHIKPISRFPHLRNDPENLQVLCASCNKGKSARYSDDWRSKTIS